MHDAVDGGSRMFGCGDDSTDPRQLSLHNDVLHKVAFLCVNAIDGSPRALECDCQSKFPWQLSLHNDILREAACLRWLCLCSVGCVPQAFGCIAVPTGLEATIVCLTMSLREADDYAYDALMHGCWKFFGETFLY